MDSERLQEEGYHGPQEQDIGALPSQPANSQTTTETGMDSKPYTTMTMPQPLPSSESTVSASLGVAALIDPPQDRQSASVILPNETVSEIKSVESSTADGVIPSDDMGNQETGDSPGMLDITPTATLSRSISTAATEKASLTAAKSEPNLESSTLGRSKSLKYAKPGNQHSSDLRLSSASHPHDYPNQGYAAHSQTHPESSSTHYMNMRGDATRLHHLEGDLDARLASASSSPRAFTPTASPHRADFLPSDTPEPFSSPFLKYTQRQAPKETHLAEVDVDPISGRKIINHYEIISELGRGVHGKVKLGRDLLTDEHVAIKIVERVSKVRRLGRTGDQEAKIKKEIAILKKARHPNIVGLLEVIDDPQKKKVYIVLELVELGEVEWRTRGEEEITLIEFRRHRREEEGVFENDAAAQEDQHILETAHRHLEREERKAFQEYQRKKDLRPLDFGHWSLEHGGEIDHEEPASDLQPNSSAAETATSDDTEIIRAKDSHGNTQADAPHIAPNPVRPDATHHDSETAVKTSRANSRAISFDDPKSDQYRTALEGTMYGPYDTSPHDGERDLLDSYASEEDVQDQWVPEHYRYVPTMTLSEARQTIRDTVLGLEYLHYQGVVHRDIKPANLLQTKDRRVKISDFGVSYLGKAVTEEGGEEPDENQGQGIDEALELAKTVGTPAFYAPELCQTDVDGEPPPVTNQIDVWALGVTLYCLVYGRIPFHDNNTFVLMRLIAEKEAYLPRRRLKAVEVLRDQPYLSPSSPSQKKPVQNCNKRLPHELEYEDVDDDLHDLLKRLLTKDPRKRIKLVEVRHHPWVIAGMEDPSRWVDESDPLRLTQGKKIEISNDDLDVAVIPLNIGDQMKNIVSRAAKKIGGALGLGKSNSRRRARSSAADTVPSSNASSSSTISQDARRQEQRRPSLKPDADALFSALKQSREGEHPLSQSVTASPELKSRPQFFTSNSQPDSPVLGPTAHPLGFHERPVGLDRGMSQTGSVRTIRQSDIAALNSSGASTMPAFPSTPLAQETATTSLSGIFGGAIGGAGKKLIKTIRNSSREFQKLQAKNSSSEISSLGSELAYGEPSIAVSNMVAAGEVDPPSVLFDGHISSSSAAPSPVSSAAGGGRYDYVPPLGKTGSLSRGSSLSSVASRGQRSLPDTHTYPRGPFLALLGDGDQPQSRGRSPFEAADAVTKAKDEQYRRLILEEKRRKKPPSVEQSLSSSPTVSQAACPPSPDDDLIARPAEEHHFHLSLGSAAMEYSQSPSRIATSVSEDHFMSGMSQSTSNPSLPSAYSADSSVAAGEIGGRKTSYGFVHADATYHPTRYDERNMHFQDETEFDGEYEDDEDDSDDGILQMRSTKKPSIPSAAQNTTAGPLDQLLSQAAPLTDRRGSTNTMIKAEPTGE